MKSDSSSNARIPTARRIWKVVLILWASPYTLMGISIGCVGLLAGGKGRIREGALEFYLGGTQKFVANLPVRERVAAITLGHVILGQTDEDLLSVSDHERIHVRQFERWGPAMGPAYLLASAWMWVLGRNAYRDNPFEVEAFTKAP